MEVVAVALVGICCMRLGLVGMVAINGVRWWWLMDE